MTNAQLLAEGRQMQALAEHAIDTFDEPKSALYWLRTKIRQELRLGSGYYTYARACFWATHRARLPEAAYA